MKIFIIDAEANSLTPTKFWCVVLKEFKKDLYYVYINDDYVSMGSFNLDVSKYKIKPLSELKEWLKNEYNSSSPSRLVGHNCIDFDFHWFKELLGVNVYDLGFDIRDSLVLSRLAFPKRPGGHSVAAWGQKLGQLKQEIADEQWSSFDPIMISRCISDVQIQEQIYDVLREKELRGFSIECIELEHEVQKLISQQRRDGVFIDEQKVHELFTETKRHADFLEREIQKVFPPRFKLIKEYHPRRTKNGEWAKRSYADFDPDIIGGDFSLVCVEPFNVNSTKQRLERLLEIGWQPTEFYKDTGGPKLTKDSLENLPEDAPKEARLIGEYLMSRSRQNLAEGLIDGLDKKGYIHGWINTIGANTHRMSSDNPNLQNIPKPTEDKQTKKILKGLPGKWGWDCRNVFTIENPHEDCLIDADASGIQLRGLAHYGEDEEYIKFVSDPKVDIHNVHSEVLGCNRAVAKTFIYALLMGAGAKKLITVLGGNDVDKGKELLNRFFERFPFLKAFKERLDKEVERGYHIALDGRLIALDEDKPHKAMSVALQSFETIVVKKAMVLYQPKLRKMEIPFVQRLTVHDEFLTQSKIKFAKQVGETMVNSIIEAGHIFNSRCPLNGEYHIGKTWAEVH